MNKLIVAGLVGALMGGLTHSAMAVEVPKPSPADARMKTVRYNARDVVRLRTHALFTTLVRFAEYESVENVATGDSQTWLVVESADRNSIFIKPTEPDLSTNLIVTTTHRTYAFELTSATAGSAASGDLNFVVSFEYPDDEVAALREKQRQADVIASPAPVGPEAWNFAYEYSGSTELKPEKVLDDGKFTYFLWDEHATVPAIFAVDSDGNESVVNFHRKGRYIVVERVERQFTLRHGKASTCIFNGTMTADGGKKRRTGRAPV